MKMTARSLLGCCSRSPVLAPAQAASLRAGLAAYDRQDYNAAAAILRPLAIAGDPRAQSMSATCMPPGAALPQNYGVAAYWYFRATNQGETTAQYMLGLMYDKGDGVPAGLHHGAQMARSRGRPCAAEEPRILGPAARCGRHQDDAAAELGVARQLAAAMGAGARAHPRGDRAVPN